MKRMLDPLASPAQGRHVHLFQDGAPASLCGVLRTYIEFEGKQVRRPLIEVKGPSSCLMCTKAMEAVTRMQLRHLSAEGLEKVIDLIQSMKNGDLRA